MPLDELRREIDRLDDQIVAPLAQRQQRVIRVAGFETSAAGVPGTAPVWPGCPERPVWPDGNRTGQGRDFTGRPPATVMVSTRWVAFS